MISASEWLSSPDGLQEYEEVVAYQAQRGYPVHVAEDAASVARLRMLVRDESLPTGYHVRQLRLGAACYLKDEARHYKFVGDLPAGYGQGSTGMPCDPTDMHAEAASMAEAIITQDPRIDRGYVDRLMEGWSPGDVREERDRSAKWVTKHSGRIRCALSAITS